MFVSPAMWAMGSVSLTVAPLLHANCTLQLPRCNLKINRLLLPRQADSSPGVPSLRATPPEAASTINMLPLSSRKPSLTSP